MRIADYHPITKDLTEQMLAGNTAGLAARDSYGHIRLNRGSGVLIATVEHTVEDVEGWFLRATEDEWGRKYAAALLVFEYEAACAPTNAGITAEVAAVGALTGPVHAVNESAVSLCGVPLYDTEGSPCSPVTERAEEVSCVECSGLIADARS